MCVQTRTTSPSMMPSAKPAPAATISGNLEDQSRPLRLSRVALAADGAQLHAIAVELDLVGPPGASRVASQASLVSWGSMKSGSACDRLGLRRGAWPSRHRCVIGPAGALSSRLLCQTEPAAVPVAVKKRRFAALPFPLVISVIIRPEATELDRRQ